MLVNAHRSPKYLHSRLILAIAPFDRHFEQNENKKNPKIKKFPELLNYPKRISNNPNPNPSILHFILNYFTAHSLQWICCIFLVPIWCTFTEGYDTLRIAPLNCCWWHSPKTLQVRLRVHSCAWEKLQSPIVVDVAKVTESIVGRCIMGHVITVGNDVEQTSSGNASQLSPFLLIHKIHRGYSRFGILLAWEQWSNAPPPSTDICSCLIW